jgi:hypothetical protein
MVYNTERKQIVSARISKKALKWFKRKADKEYSTVSRLVARYLEKIAQRNSK